MGCAEGTDAPQALRRGGNLGRVGSIPVFVFPGMAGHPCPTLRAISLSLQDEENRHIPERDDLGTPSCQGVKRLVWDPKTFAEAHPTGRAVSEEGLGEWDGQTGV